MPSQRDLFKQVAEETTKDVTKKRAAPKPKPTKEQAVIEQREKDISRGKEATWRLHPDIKPAIARAAKQHNVTQRSLVEYILTKALVGLATGKIDLPIQESERAGAAFVVEPQDIPDEFLE